MRRHPHVLLAAAACACVLSTLTFGRSTSAGASTPAEGCLNQWLFNGVWRVKVTRVDPMMDGTQQVGWQVTEVWRNGSSQEVAPGDSLQQPQSLELDDDSKISSGDTSAGSGSYTTMTTHEFVQSSQFSYVQLFRAPAGFDFTKKPKVVDISFDAATLPLHKAQPQFTTAHPNFRFRLDCTASGAVANAAGGSSALPGKEGCMNQWMSNGIWKRATAVAKDTNGDPNAPQVGWAVTEEWMNETGQTLSPYNMGVLDQQLILASGDAWSGSQSAGSQMSGQKLAFNTFAPGASLTYAQLFRPSVINTADAPSQLIVAFDAKSVNQRPNVPHFTSNPPNYRINLTCNK